MDQDLVLNNKQVVRAINQLRAGDLESIGMAAFLLGVVIVVAIIHSSSGFINPGRGVFDRPHPPGQAPRDRDAGSFPPILDKFRPKNTYPTAGMASQPKLCMTPSSQIVKFTDSSGQVDLKQCYDEVLRRVRALNCNNFVCSFKEYRNLATECGKVTPGNARAAITALQNKMLGYYTHVYRVDYGHNIEGVDYGIDGCTIDPNITHLETKNLVGSDIQIAENHQPNVKRQASRAARKFVWQLNFWSNRVRIKTKHPHLKPTAHLPASPNNTLGLIDCYDVSSSAEKADVVKSFTDAAVKRNATNFVFINNETNP